MASRPAFADENHLKQFNALIHRAQQRLGSSAPTSFPSLSYTIITAAVSAID